MPTYDKIVGLACKGKDAAPKAKYLEPIIATTWSNDGAFNDVCEALLSHFGEQPLVVWRALIVLHVMIRNGSTDKVSSYLSSAALDFGNVSGESWIDNLPGNIKRYAVYLGSRIRAHHDSASGTGEPLGHNAVASGSSFISQDLGGTTAGKTRLTTSSEDIKKNETMMGRSFRSMSVEAGLLNAAKLVQMVIDSLLDCRFDRDDLRNGLVVAALRMLVKDLLAIFPSYNERMVNLLELHSKMSYVDAEELYKIYLQFCAQIQRVLEYLSIAKKLQKLLGVPIPTLEHAPVSLADTLLKYLEQKSNELKGENLATDHERGSIEEIPNQISVTHIESEMNAAGPSTYHARTNTSPTSTSRNIDFLLATVDEQPAVDSSDLVFHSHRASNTLPKIEDPADPAQSGALQELQVHGNSDPDSLETPSTSLRDRHGMRDQEHSPHDSFDTPLTPLRDQQEVQAHENSPYNPPDTAAASPPVARNSKDVQPQESSSRNSLDASTVSPRYKQNVEVHDPPDPGQSGARQELQVHGNSDPDSLETPSTSLRGRHGMRDQEHSPHDSFDTPLTPLRDQQEVQAHENSPHNPPDTAAASPPVARNSKDVQPQESSSRNSLDTSAVSPRRKQNVEVHVKSPHVLPGTSTGAPRAQQENSLPIPSHNSDNLGDQALLNTYNWNVINTSIGHIKDHPVLREHVLFDALPGSAERWGCSKCFPETSMAILDRIDNWVTGSSQPVRPIMWLQGAAGAGKSAVSYTLAERWKTRGAITASFFIHKEYAVGKIIESHIIPTLAIQLSDAIRPMRPRIYDILEKEPRLFEESLEVQFKKIIIETVSLLGTLGTSVLIIDGLDECIAKGPEHVPGSPHNQILDAIASVIYENHRKNPLHRLCFLITSRPEHQIRECFGRPPIDVLTETVSLNEWQLYSDVERFLVAQFTKLNEDNSKGNDHGNLNQELVPGAIKYFATKSSGRFILPCIVLKALENHHLSVLLDSETPRDTHTSNPFQPLDDIFLEILNAVPIESRPIMMTVFKIIITDTHETTSHLFFGTVRYSPDFFEKYMFLRRHHIYQHLENLHSLLAIPPKNFSKERPITFLHPTLRDFLTNPRRSECFAINKAEALLELQRVRLKHIIIQSVSPASSGSIGYIWDGFLSEFESVLQYHRDSLLESDDIKLGLFALLREDSIAFSAYMAREGLPSSNSERNQDILDHLRMCKDVNALISEYVPQVGQIPQLAPEMPVVLHRK